MDLFILIVLIACCSVNRQSLQFLLAHIVSGWFLGIMPHRILIPSVDWLNMSSFELSGAVAGAFFASIVYTTLTLYTDARRNLKIASSLFATVFFVDAILNHLHAEKTIDYTSTFIFSEFSPYIFGVGMNFTVWQCIMLTIDSYIIYLLIANERRHALHLLNSVVDILRVRFKNTYNSIIRMLPSSKAVIHKNKNHIEKNS